MQSLWEEENKVSIIEVITDSEYCSVPLLRLYNAEDKQIERVYKDYNAPINIDIILYLILRQVGSILIKKQYILVSLKLNLLLYLLHILSLQNILVIQIGMERVTLV